MKIVILSKAKDLKWPKSEILRYALNDKKSNTRGLSPCVLIGGKKLSAEQADEFIRLKINIKGRDSHE